MLRELLSGQTNGPASDMLCLNTGAALLANEQVTTLADGFKLARDTLHTGKARTRLADVIACSHAMAR